MIIEQITLKNFRCFGATPETFALSPILTTFVGANGAGKTAVMQALLRLFGISGEQRRVRRQDFHIAVDEVESPLQRSLSVEVILGFPELEEDNDEDLSSIPEFFQQMAADDNGVLKCRIRLDATWTDDGSADGSVEAKLKAIRTLAAEFGEDEWSELSAIDRARIQMIYVPATRDPASQLTAFLKGRVWRAVLWSTDISGVVKQTAETLNSKFIVEPAVEIISEAFSSRWQEVHNAGTDAIPVLRPMDAHLQEFIRRVEIVFRPDESGRDRALDGLSDGQRSLFQIAMTAATLDIEAKLVIEKQPGFKQEGLMLPALTLVAIEEPENNLAPFYLSRIIGQVQSLSTTGRAQAIISSHSASILGRIEPTDVRYFRLEPGSRTAKIRKLTVPAEPEEASKFVREAVRSYPELYFAQFVILGEGSSEEVVLPLIAEAMQLRIDRSFVAVVPLGGRHVNHLWRLLNDLEIPHATLLDLDYGRSGGGWGRVKLICKQLLKVGVSSDVLFKKKNANAKAHLAAFESFDDEDWDELKSWVHRLRDFGVFFCSPLDLDMSMLKAFPAAYKQLPSGVKGPSSKSEAVSAVLGEEGKPELYGDEWHDFFSWYRYLFLGRGKPSTHVRVMITIKEEELREKAPHTLKKLLNFVAERIDIAPLGDLT